jgi:hypothetical protein
MKLQANRGETRERLQLRLRRESLEDLARIAEIAQQNGIDPAKNVVVEAAIAVLAREVLEAALNDPAKIRGLFVAAAKRTAFSVDRGERQGKGWGQKFAKETPEPKRTQKAPQTMDEQDDAMLRHFYFRR